jgi:ATP-dependent helicase HrpA
MNIFPPGRKKGEIGGPTPCRKMSHKLIDEVKSLLPGAMAVDRWAVQRELHRRIGVGVRKAPAGGTDRLAVLKRRLLASGERRRRRMERLPVISEEAALPITAHKDAIIAAIRRHPVVIVSGETGSGKSTQIPKFCMAAGRGVDGLIGCTQPRRIAATSIAARIAAELAEPLGRSVGYKIRFQDRTPPEAFIKIMTDGILLAEAQGDRWLSEYDTLIVDEAHERSLNIDFVLGLLKTLLAERHDLKLIITSATIDTEKFARAFGDAPVIEVSGRMYPVAVKYIGQVPELKRMLEKAEADPTHIELAAAAVRRLLTAAAAGDILVFMPTEQDIRETCDLLEGAVSADVQVLPLFARLSAAEQSRVFAAHRGRKVIVATNVAETSLTIPGIRYVVDTGLARISQYNPRTRTTALPIVPVSRSSADQRMGRCGRVAAGVCIRLFIPEDYDDRPQFTPPEILRSNLAEVILRMLALHLGDIADFPFIDGPTQKSVDDGLELLKELGAIADARKAGHSDHSRHRPDLPTPGTVETADNTGGAPARQPEYRLTERGRLMARLPVDPRLARLLIEAQRWGCLAEVVVIAAALSIQDPRERPADRAGEADERHAVFNHPQSDFLTLVNLWNAYDDLRGRKAGTNRLKRFCRENFLSYRRMREWRDIHDQIRQILEESGFERPGQPVPDGGQHYEAVHQAIISGFLSNIAQKKEKNVYRAAKGRDVMVFPGSGVFDKGGDWIVAAELVETTRLFARTVAVIRSDWLETAGGELCRHTYLNPRWSRRRGEVVATEQISLFGLVFVSDRTVSYGRIDPEAASDLFIRQALVDEDVERPLPFMQHNRRLVEGIREMEARVRRRDLLVSEEERFRLYRGRLGPVYDLPSLKKAIRRQGGDGFLRFRREDLLLSDPDTDIARRYPDHIRLGSRRFRCSYRFTPGAPEDGLTVHVPATAAPEVPAEEADWMVPGLLKEKIAALIKLLPKAYRKRLLPLAKTTAIIADGVQPDRGPLVASLSDFIYRRFGLDIPASAWSVRDLPEHLRMRIAVTGPGGEVLKSGRDATLLKQGFAPRLETDQWEAARQRWEKAGVTDWDFGDLPDSVAVDVDEGVAWQVFPGLALNDTGNERIDLKLFRNRDAALASHLEGVSALMERHFAREIKFLKKSLTLSGPLAAAAGLGGINALQERMVKRVVRDLFRRNLRTRAEFVAATEAARRKMMPAGRQWLERVTAVVETYRDTRDLFRPLPDGGVADEMRAELAQLVPDSFVELYDPPRMEALPRYIRALGIRAQRAAVNPEKDRLKTDQVRPFSAALAELLQTLTEDASAQKRRALEAFYWLIEEYKVSLFAQELGTAVPVSPKRLQDKLAELRRMA